MGKDTIETLTVTVSDDIDISNVNMTTTLTNLDDDLTVTYPPICPLNPDRDLMGQNVDRFLRSLLDPEMFGHAVTAEVRDEARALLGLKRVETVEAE